MKYSFKKYVSWRLLFLQMTRAAPRKKKTLPFRERPFPAVNYFRACLSIQMFLLKLAM